MMLTVHPAAVNGDWGKRAQQLARPLLDASATYSPETGKEIVMRLLIVLAMLAVFTTGLVGCKAEGEIGDTQTSVGAPR